MKKPTNQEEDSLLLRALEENLLPELLGEYLTCCHEAVSADGKRREGGFPNLAGFCRFLGCGLSDLEALRVTNPTLSDRISAILEDEALNALLSPTLLNAYLKRRLNYVEHPESTATDCGEMRLVFEHDILEDGE